MRASRRLRTGKCINHGQSMPHAEANEAGYLVVPPRNMSEEIDASIRDWLDKMGEVVMRAVRNGDDPEHAIEAVKALYDRRVIDHAYLVPAELRGGTMRRPDPGTDVCDAEIRPTEEDDIRVRID